MSFVHALARRGERASRRSRLASRPVLSDEQIYKEFYGGEAISFDEFLRAWRTIGSHLHVEAGRLRPTDMFADLLGVPAWLPRCAGYSGDVDDLAYTADLRNSAIDAREINTVDDLVYYLSGRSPRSS